MGYDLRICCAVGLGVVLVSVSGCVSVKTQEEIEIRKEPPVVRQGVYHKVKKGETLWRIAKTYQVTVSDITRANNISKAARIENNQLVFIPGADKAVEIFQNSAEEQSEFIWPVKGKVLKYFHEKYGNRVNKGIDIQSEAGVEVKASRTGRVVFADFLTGYGYTVILDHLDGYYTVYAKNAKLLVKLDDHVLKNSPIAQVGHNRNLAFLHFQIRKSSKENNPLFYLP